MLAISETEKRILQTIAPHAQALGFELVRVRVDGGTQARVQIMAERPNGSMDVEDCAQLSRAAGAALDIEDPVREPYTLEVSSPGIDRPLTRPGDFARWAGHKARIDIHPPLNGQRRFSGKILSEADGSLRLALSKGAEEACIDLAQIVRAKLVLTDDLIAASQDRTNTIPKTSETGET